MKALISPNEPVFNPNTGEQIGVRVCEIQSQEFEIAPPLFWVDCNESVVADQYCYNNELFVEVAQLLSTQPEVDNGQPI